MLADNRIALNAGWDLDPLWRIGKDQDAETVHGTQKPIECMHRPIVNNTSPGEAVYEPLLGSRTTLIAADSVGRIYFAVELSPNYVDVRS